MNPFQPNNQNDYYLYVIQELALTPEIESLTQEDRYRFVEYLFNQTEQGQQVWPDLINRMAPQYDAEVLRQDLIYGYKNEISKSNIVGVLGLTTQDLYTQDYNFLFFFFIPESAIMSIHRFYDGETLMTQFIRRSVNQAFSSTGFILGIPRCTVSSCPRAYPHSLKEHDLKEDDLCFECKEALSNL